MPHWHAADRNHFRRHVRHCADKFVDFANHRGIRVAQAHTGAKVGNLGVHVHVQQHIVALQIAVNDAALVQVPKAEKNLG